MARPVTKTETKHGNAEAPSRAGWGLWLAVLVAAFLRLHDLGAQSLWVDEIFTWQTASPTAPLTALDLVSNIHGPLVSAFAHFWMKLFGQSEFALRLPMALAAIAIVPAIAALARRVAGPAAALPAAWIAALSPFLTWYGQEFRGYVIAMLFATLALSALLDWRKSGSRRDFAWTTVWTALMCWSNMSGVLLVPVMAAAFAFGAQDRRARVVAPLAYLAFVALALSPWIVYHLFARLGWYEWGRLVPGGAAVDHGEPLRGDMTFSWLGIPFTFYVFATGYTLGPSLRDLRAGGGLDTLLPFAPVIVASLLTFGTLALAGLATLSDRARRFERGIVLGVLLVPIAIVCWFALSNFKVFNPRYVAVGAPAFLVLLAAGWLALRKPARILAGLAVAVLSVLSLFHHFAGARYAKDDFRRATHALDEVVAPQDVIVAAGNFSPLEYYWRDKEPVPVVYWAGYARDERMEPKFLELANPAGATWLVVSRTHELDPEGRFEAWIAKTWGAPIGVFPGVRVYRISAPVR